MENEVTAPRAGTVTELAVSELQPVNAGDRICTVSDADGG
jgi:biotin carboxyl carrier protein